MLGPQQPVILHILDIPAAASSLDGVKMELLDSAFPLLKGVVATTDAVKACTGVNIAVMVAGMERKDRSSENYSFYESQASALGKHAAPDCKVLVVGTPANANPLILEELAPSILKKNITVLTRLDHNRALAQISERLAVPVSDVKNVIIWDKHSSRQSPDANHASVKTRTGEKPPCDPDSIEAKREDFTSFLASTSKWLGIPVSVAENSCISKIHPSSEHAVVKTPSGEMSVLELISPPWLSGEFIRAVQQREEAVISVGKLSSALSTASAACDQIRDWVLGTPEGTWVSMGVYSDGSYNVPRGVIYSFPVTCRGGEWTIVEGLYDEEAYSGVFTIPNVKWEDIFGHDAIKAELYECIIRPIKDPKAYEGLEHTFLLHGPTGCGKTLLVQALAKDAGISFVHLKSVFELEKEDCLRVADSPPCIIFFDFVYSAKEYLKYPAFLKVREHLLKFFQLQKEQKRVYVIWSETSLDAFYEVFGDAVQVNALHVPPPTPEERGQFLEYDFLKRCSGAQAHVDLSAFGRKPECNGFSFSILSRLLDEAVKDAVHDGNRTSWVPVSIESKHLNSVLPEIQRMSYMDNA